MKFNLTVTVSVIIALISLISPILTALINNRHQTKLKKLELQQQQYEKTVIYIRDILQNYLKAVSSKMTRYYNTEILNTYGEYYALAYIYASDNSKKLMRACDEFIATNPAHSIHWEYFEDLSVSIYKDILALSQK